MLGSLIWTAAMSITEEREALLNEIYDREHVPALLQVPGVLRVRRYRRVRPAGRRYLAAYEIADPDVPTSEPWLRARNLGRWPTEVRPWTSGLVNGLYAWRSGFGGESPADAARLFLWIAALDAGAASLPVPPGGPESVGEVAAAHYVETRNGSHLVIAAARPDGRAAEATPPSWLGPPDAIETYAPVGAGATD